MIAYRFDITVNWQVYSTTASTSGLQRHIDHHERSLGTVPIANGVVKVEPANSSLPPNTTPPPVPNFPSSVSRPRATPKTFNPPFNGEEIFLKTAVHEYIPIREVADQFNQVYRTFTGGKNPDVLVLEGKLRESFFRKREEVKRFLQEFNSRISVSAELWTSATEQTYLIATAHLMSEKWEPLRFVLDCVLVSPDINSDSISDLLNLILAEFEITDKVLAVTTGNEKVMEAFNAFKPSVSQKPGGPISHVKCIGWGLTMCVQPALDHVRDHINKVRRFLKMLLNSRKGPELASISALLLHDYQEIKLDIQGQSFWIIPQLQK